MQGRWQLRTERLALRPFVRDDLVNLHQLWTNPGVRKYLWDDKIIPRERVQEEIESSLNNFELHGYGHWALLLHGDSALAGFCGLKPSIEPAAAELYYALAPEYWGQGVVVEAAVAVLHHGFQERKLARVRAGTDPPNTASIRVMEKLGMSFERRTLVNGLDVIYYTLTREQFTGRGGSA